MARSLDETLAFHCAPALVGVKPANLVCCDMRQYPGFAEQVIQLGEMLGPQGIRFRTVCRCEQRALLLVYREAVLARHLSGKTVQSYLKKAGYPQGGVEAVLRHLEKQLAGNSQFPHEAGVILGYPPEDVEGFLRHRGKNCKMSGYWKVYGNETEAKALFEQFTRCRETLCSLVAGGATIAELLGAA